LKKEQSLNPHQIKLERTAHLLIELIPEALSSLNDNRLHGIAVVDVKLSRGKSDAKVYLDPSFILDDEKPLILKQIKKASPIIQEYIMRDQGWFRSPNLTFFFDDLFKESSKIEALFNKIKDRGIK
jgi:ribosome-binding factor A